MKPPSPTSRKKAKPFPPKASFQVHSKYAAKLHPEPITVCKIVVGPSMAYWSTLRVSLLCSIQHLSVFSTDHGALQVQSSEENLYKAGRLGLDNGPHNTSPCRGQTHQIIVAGSGGRGAHFLTLWGLWVSEITLERWGDGDRAVVRQQHCSILAVSNRQDDTQVI